MGLTNYTHTFIIEAESKFGNGSVPKLFDGILQNDGEGNLNFNISKELGYLFESESQFNKVFSEEYGLLEYSKIFSSDTIKLFVTLQDAKPWFDSSELTLINKTEQEFDYYNAETFMRALDDIIKHLNRFYWDAGRPKLFERLEEFKLLKVIVSFCIENHFKIKTIMS
jgi:hypothetical protein